MKNKIDCPHCYGSGTESTAFTPDIECTNCEGYGWIYALDDVEDEDETSEEGIE